MGARVKVLQGEVQSGARAQEPPIVQISEYDPAGRPGLQTLAQSSFSVREPMSGLVRFSGLELKGGVLFVEGNLSVGAGGRDRHASTGVAGILKNVDGATVDLVIGGDAARELAISQDLERIGHADGWGERERVAGVEIIIAELVAVAAADGQQGGAKGDELFHNLDDLPESVSEASAVARKPFVCMDLRRIFEAHPGDL